MITVMMITSVKATVSCLWLAVLCSQTLVVRGVDRHDMSTVTEALEYVQEIANQGEGNCSFGPTLDLEYDRERWTAEAAVAVRAANLLTALSRTGDHIFGAGDEDEQLMYAITMANVDNNLNVFGSAIAFDYLLYRDYEVFSPYAFRAAYGATEVKDLSIGYNYLTNSTDWFYIPFLKFQNQSLDDSHPASSQASNSSSVPRLDASDGYWTRPYFDCGGGNVWMVTFSMPFFLPARVDATNFSTAMRTDTLVFAGVTTIDVALSALDINQCSHNDSDVDSQTVFDPFVDTHLCKNTTYCRPISGRGFERGAYQCICSKGYYYPQKATPSQAAAFNGSELENEYSKKVRGYPNIYDSDFNCVQCMKGCDECLDDSPCFLAPSTQLRYAALTLTGACILVLAVLAIFTWIKRENKVFKAASPGLLYVFLFGSAIMYSEVILHAALTGHLASWHCILQPWARYIGIALAYGALLFKTWRITQVFAVRSAKPVRITDGRLYVRIGVLVILMSLYLGVGTYVHPSTVELRETSDKLKYEQCTTTTWSYVGEGVTLLLLGWGVYLCVKVRKAPSAFNESKFISICIYNETLMLAFSIISTTVVLESVDLRLADTQFIVGLCRVHLTVTVMVALLYGSKIYHVVQQSRREETGGTQLGLTRRQQGGRGPLATTGTGQTLDSISPTIDFCYTNPDVKTEIERLSKVLESIQETLTLQDTSVLTTSITSLRNRLEAATSRPPPGGSAGPTGEQDDVAAGDITAPAPPAPAAAGTSTDPDP